MLEIDRLSVRYGPVTALREASLRIGSGEIVALLGANGAGKSSLLRAVSRLVPTAGGSVRFLGADLAPRAAHELPGLGLSHCPEGRRVFPGLTVDENLDLGAGPQAGAQARRRAREKAYALFPELAGRRNQPGGTLSGGEQQMLALGRALAAEPRLLLLDEPSLGLAPLLIDRIFDAVRAVNRETGLSILLVEQNANEALLHADRGCVLELGRIVREGPAAELLRDPRVREAYLG